MIRVLYSVLLSVHPRAFRQRFADEMLGIFDEIPANAGRASLLYDVLRSLAVQWLFRSRLWIFALAILLALILGVIGLHPYGD
ncbi:MAG: hypothetical protein ACRD50_14640 [Candidatus Acidiferrales bacterium]